VTTGEDHPLSTISKVPFHLVRTALVPAAIVAAAIAAVLMFTLLPDETSAGPPIVFTVNTTDDVDDTTCNVTHCSLHEAIDAANAANPAEIRFDLPGCPASCTIDISTNPPAIFGDNIAIDGTSQNGYVDDPIVVLNWIGLGIGDGPKFHGVGSSITSMKIINFRFGFTLNNADQTANGNHIVDAEVDGIWASGANITVTDNIVEGSGRIGIHASTGDGIPNSLISGNVVTNSTLEGLRIQGDGVTISGNTVSTNTASGILHSFGSTDVTIENNVVTDNGKVGIRISAASSLVKDNTVSGNGWAGMSVGSADNVVTGNTVSGNGHAGTNSDRRVGIELSGTNTVFTDNHVFDNAGHGMYVEGTSTYIGGINPGDANTITGNGGSGIFVAEADVAEAEGSGSAAPAGLESDPTNNTISGNIIFGNAGLGIDLAPEGVTANDQSDNDDGANRRQNFPVLTAAISGSLHVEGSLNSAPNSTFMIEFFANDTCDISGHGEGQEFLANPVAETDGEGNVSFDYDLVTGVVPGRYLTATATSLTTSDTSEFSACLEVTSAATPTPAPTAQPTASPTPPPSGQRTAGDLDCDSTVGTRDSQAILRNVLEQPPLSQTGDCPLIGAPVTVDGNDGVWGDVDCDGTVGTRDSQALLRNVLEQPALSQTPPCPLIGALVQVSD